MNKLEVESKILDIDRGLIGAKILELGGKKIFDGELTAIALQNKQGYRIRVRQEGDNGTAVEHKDHLPSTDHFTYANETGFVSDDLENTAKTFEKLGFERVKFDIKNRISYLLNLGESLGTVRYDFDYYTDTPIEVEIPEFVEVEGVNEQQVIMGANMIGYKLSDLKGWSMSQVVEYYQNRLGKAG